MQAMQIELLKIEWGESGFCTEWNRDYDRMRRKCTSQTPEIRRQ